MTGQFQSRKQYLFQVYSTNLSFYYPEFEGRFACPICLSLFDSGAVASKELTIEHIIPSSIGGRIVTMTCRRCNNQAGTELESHMVKRLQVEDVFAGQSDNPVDARVNVGSGEFGADVYYSKNDPNIRIVEKPHISDPKKRRKALEKFELGAPTITIHGKLGYEHRPSLVGVLRAAYLLAFRFFGYGYILYGSVEQIRRQIRNPHEEMDVIRFVRLDDNPPTNTMGLLKQPKALRCFLAILNLSTQLRRVYAVVLPGLDSGSSGTYNNWTRAADSFGDRMPPNIVTFFNYKEEVLTSEEYKHVPALIWRRVIDT